MKTLKSSIFYLFILSLFASCSSKEQVTIEANYQVIPLPQEIKVTDNVNNASKEGFVLSGHTKIVYPKGNMVQKQTAEFLSEYIKFNTGIGLVVTDAESDENAIILRADYKSDKPESYNLIVNDKHILINGSDDAGTFYGVQTIRKSIPAYANNKKVILPAVEIIDYPRFQYRGMHLDVSRHFFPADFVKKYIDILALHNLNTFHWHLTDDQGWRIEIKKYPKLTEIGSLRNRTVIGHNSGEFDSIPYGGFYTQDEIKDIVAYAEKRFITIIPEIDLPGHMVAALTSYPALGCTGGPYEVEGQWGVFDDVLCAGNDSVYTFIDDVFTEVIELFPSQLIHIGGDECPKTRWKECPKCQAKIKKLGITADPKHSKEDKLQSHMIAHTEKFLNSKGRQIIGWDEILEGGLAPNATVMSWRGMDGGITAAKEHHNVIMTPNSHLYFDQYQSKDTQSEPVAIGGYLPVERVYNFEPVPSNLTDEEKKYIIGTQANMWAEYIPDSKQIEYMLLPRIAALAEVQWTMPEKKDYETFLPRLARLLELYKKLGYNYATHITDIAAKVEPSIENGVTTLSLFTYDNAPIYYTLDGSEPTEKSTPYSKPLEIKSTTTVKAIAVRDKKETSRVYTNSFGFNKATLKPITLENEPNKTHSYEGAITLVDGKKGGNSFSSGEWLGFIGSDFVATVDLGDSTEVSEVTIGTFMGASSWIFGATEFVVAVSTDGKTFKQVFDEKYPPFTETQPEETVNLVAKFAPEKARYVKITAKPTASIPDWHAGKGKPAFLFIDEIAIN